MIRPRERSAKIDGIRTGQWLARFSSYFSSVTKQAIELWLDQFLSKDKDLAARILDSVLFVSHDSIHACYRDLLKGLEGWSEVASQRKGRWFFVPYSGSTGESGDTMVHVLRMATGLDKKHFDKLFIHRSELVMAQPGPDDTVVLLDDFSGSGQQACGSWRDVFSELLTNRPKIVLMLIAATKTAISRVKAETPMHLVCGNALSDRDNIFHAECKHFNSTEKATLLRYCQRADPKHPRGFGDCGLLLVFAHRCPNNTVPIFHVSHRDWQGLFPRHS